MRWMGRISVKGQRIDEWMKVKLLYIEREWPVYGWRDSGGRWKSIITADKTSYIVVQELGFSSPVGINVKMLMDSAQLQKKTLRQSLQRLYIQFGVYSQLRPTMYWLVFFSFLPPPRSSEQKQSLLMWIHHQDGLVYFQGCDSTFLLPSAEWMCTQ